MVKFDNGKCLLSTSKFIQIFRFSGVLYLVWSVVKKDRPKTTLNRTQIKNKYARSIYKQSIIISIKVLRDIFMFWENLEEYSNVEANDLK